MQNMVRSVWCLESGFNNVNEARDNWFKEHPVFLGRHEKTTGHITFVPVESVVFPACEASAWETTKATLVEASEDGRYRCYQTESGTRYHLWKKATIELL